MSLDQRFSQYMVFDPGVDRPLKEVSRSDAEKHFEHHFASIEERLDKLQRLLGPETELDFSDHSLEQLDNWFPAFIARYCTENEWPTPEAFSLSNDVAMYLGETLLRRGPHLKWRLELSHKQDISYQRPVVAGFRKVLQADLSAVLLDVGGGQKEP